MADFLDMRGIGVAVARNTTHIVAVAGNGAVVHTRVVMAESRVPADTAGVVRAFDSATVNASEKSHAVVECGGSFELVSHNTAVIAGIPFYGTGVHTSANGGGKIGKTNYTAVIALCTLNDAVVGTAYDTATVCGAHDTAVPTRIAIVGYGTIVDTVFDCGTQRCTGYTAHCVVTGNGTRNSNILHIGILQHTEQASKIGSGHIHGKVGDGVTVAVEMAAEGICV